MTQLELALNNKTSQQMLMVSKKEGIDLNLLKKNIASGKIVILNNKLRPIKKSCAVGKALHTKINANIGVSSDKNSIKEELDKLRISQEYGADTAMDLSVAGDIAKIRKTILAQSLIPIGTVPVYEAAVQALKEKKSFLRMDADDMLAVIEKQAQDGVDFMTIHCGVTLSTIKKIKDSKRLLGIVSRGGAILASWMKHNKKENPFFVNYDKILRIAYKYDVVLSLGDGLRPGSICDATDYAQIAELKLLGKLAKQARENKVQVIIEGPGHVSLNQISRNIKLQKKYCDNSPFYVLGPLVTDIASTQDHIAGAIGGALAASLGADFLCVVSPAEHLRHPSVEDIKQGVIASRIAAHSADIAKGIKGAIQWDHDMSCARKKRDWQKQIALSIDPKKAKEYRGSSKPHLSDVCTMCSEFCSIKLMEDCLKN